MTLEKKENTLTSYKNKHSLLAPRLTFLSLSSCLALLELDGLVEVADPLAAIGLGWTHLPQVCREVAH